MCNRGSPLRVDGEAGPGLGGALSRLLGAGQEINCEEEIGNIEREATHSTHRAAPAPCGRDTFNLYSVENGRRPHISQ